MPIEIGDTIRTSYGTGPYQVLRITAGCNCRSYLDVVNDRVRRVIPHLHFLVRDLRDGGSNCHLNRYVYMRDGRCVSLDQVHSSWVPVFQPHRRSELFIVSKVQQVSLFAEAT